jgi:hypothetical protein
MSPLPGIINHQHVLTTKGGLPMISVVEWFAPVRNSDWVAACFGLVDL